MHYASYQSNSFHFQFFRTLREEINESQNPSIFCLTKIALVAEANMGRIKIIWSQLWNVIKDHLSVVGCHKNINIAKMAVNELKLLASKFLPVQ